MVDTVPTFTIRKCISVLLPVIVNIVNKSIRVKGYFVVLLDNLVKTY